MLSLNNLPKQVAPAQKRVGRGHGSGLGKTAGRGTKGQKARERIGLSFEGGQLRLIKRLPFRRGVGNPKGGSQLAINLSDLVSFKKGDRVSPETLIAAGLISAGEARRSKIKVLGGGEIKAALTFEVPVSQSAAKKIVAAGGRILVDSTDAHHTLSEKGESKGETTTTSS